MERLRRINCYIKYVEKFLLAVTVGFMVLLLVANVFCRFVLNDSLSFAEEVGILLFIACTYFGCPYCVRKCKHIRMSALIERMPDRIAKRYSIVVDLITAAVFIFLGIGVAKYCAGVYLLGSVTPALRIPRWICILPIPIGCIGTGFQYILLVLMNITDKDSYWIGTERRNGESDMEEGELV